MEEEMKKVEVTFEVLVNIIFSMAQKLWKWNKAVECSACLKRVANAQSFYIQCQFET